MSEVHAKITLRHLERSAVVYLRQSTEKQVRHNTESRRLQYALADRARDLGFLKVEVIDSDLGVSAAAGGRRREGFERLLAQVARRRGRDDLQPRSIETLAHRQGLVPADGGLSSLRHADR